MSLIKIITIIVVIWLILKVKHFIAKIHIRSQESLAHKKKKSRKTGMDIQDADYEDVE
jgi:hypothetical protein